MLPRSLNRFALIAEDEDDDDNPSPTDPSADAITGPLSSSPHNDNPWREIKKKNRSTKILTIQNGNHAYLRSGECAADDVSRHASSMPRLGSRSHSHISPVSSHNPHTPLNHLENWCGVCNYQFGSKSLLWTHVRQSAGHENVCNLCKRVFKDRNGLQNHRDNAPGHEIFCNLCLSAFKDNWGLRNHFENNLTASHRHEFFCLVCLLGFNTKDSLQYHLRTDEKHVWCNTCDRKFKSQDERDKHWLKTKNHRHCLQPGCEYDCEDNEQLEKHLKEDHFQCKDCLSVFISQTRLNAHMETCEASMLSVREPGHMPTPTLRGGQGEEGVQQTAFEADIQAQPRKTSKLSCECWLCDTTFFSMTHLIKHLETGKCPRFPDPSYLHLVISKMWYTPLYMDPDIHRQIRTNQVTLKDFMDFVKSGFVPYRCHEMNACGKMFGDLRSLVHHVESGECKWTLETLRLNSVEKEFMRYWDGRKMVWNHG